MVDVQYPAQLGGLITMPEDDLAIRVAGASSQTTGALGESGSLVYANAYPGVDFIAAPVPGGLEAFALVRDRSARHQLELDLSLPREAVLRRTGRGAQVSRGGDALLDVPPPTAIDASGESVPVRLEVEGSSLTVSARAGQAEYPLLIDPAIVRTNWSSSTQYLDRWTQYKSSANADYDLRQVCNTNWLCGQTNGNYIYARGPSGTTWSPGETGGWYYRVPQGTQSSVFFSHAAFQGVDFRKNADQRNRPRLHFGVWSPRDNKWVRDKIWTDDAPASGTALTPPADAAPYANGQQLNFYMEVSSSASSIDLTSRREAYLGGIEAYLSDFDPTTISATWSGVPSGWTASANPTITGTASNAALGVRQIHVGHWAGTWPYLTTVSDQRTHPCDPTNPQALCPQQWSQTFNLNSAQMTEGVHNLSPGTIDIGDGASTYGSAAGPVLKVDRTAPTVALSGSTTTGSGYQLQIAAQDGRTSFQDAFEEHYLARSGVKSVEILVKDSSGAWQRVDYAEQPCTPVLGSCPMSRTFNFDEIAVADQFNVRVIAKDQLGHTTTKDLDVNVTGAAEPKVERVTHDGLDDWVSLAQGQPARAIKTRVFARDSRKALDKNDGKGVSKLTLRLPGQARMQALADCTGPSGCPAYTGKTLSWSAVGSANGGPLTEGVHQGFANAYSTDGQVSQSKPFDIKVDSSAPQITKFDAIPAYAPNTQTLIGYDLIVESSDGVPNPTTPAQKRSGVRSVEIFSRGERRFAARFACAAGNCAGNASFRYRASREDLINLGQGQVPGDLKAVVTDGAGNVAVDDSPSPAEPPAGGPDLSTQATERGLEQFFHYDSLETGASGSHVNLGTGNLTWHKVPVVNPGRGLSSVINVTYNSDDHHLSELIDLGFGQNNDPTDNTRAVLSSLLADLGVGYNEVGSGFSTSISGLTRINEPLGGVFTAQLGDIDAILNPGSITMTDPDGTKHVFAAKPDEPGAFEAPAGVDLRLRQYSTSYFERYNTDASNTGPLDQTLSQNKAKFWAMTRPDGVTYFFDQLGYARSIEDRNGNQIKFVYELVNPTTGLRCDRGLDGQPLPQGAAVPVIPGFCEPRMSEVIDAAGNDTGASAALRAERTIEIDYYELPAPTAITPEGLASAGKIKSITDHANRVMEFTYDSGGRLQSLTEAKDPNPLASSPTDAQRTTSFQYQGPDLLLGHQQLSSVTDPNNKTTHFEYYEALEQIDEGYRDDLEALDVGDLLTFPFQDLPDRHVKMTTNRSGAVRSYDFEAPGEGGPLNVVLGENAASVVDARGTERRYTIDSRQRVEEILEVLKPAASGVSEQNRVTTLDWTQDNRVSLLTEGATRQGSTLSTSGAATTRYSYNENGALTSTTDPLGRTTRLIYGNTAGIHRADPVAGAPSIDSDSDGFVSDLWLLRRPNENGLTLGYEQTRENGTPVTATDGTTALNGNVILETDSTGVSTSQTYDLKGQVKTRTDQEGNKTEYVTYDPSGMATEIVAPRGTNDSITGAPKDGKRAQHRWLYRYDSVGNLLQSVDPRGASGLTTIPANHSESAPYTTTLKYDDLDRLISERFPRCSSPQGDPNRPNHSDPDLSLASSLDDCTAETGAAFAGRAYTYDKNGNQLTRVDASGATFSSQYTPMDRTASQTAPAGPAQTPRLETTRFCYDREQGLERILTPKASGGCPAAPPTDPMSAGVSTPEFATRFVLDPLGRRVAAVRGGTGASKDLITSYALDLRDNIVGVAKPKDNSSVQTQNGAPVYTSVSVADAVTRAGQFTTQRERITYDLADQVVASIEDPDDPGTTPIEGLDLRSEFRYDSNGNRTAILHPRGFKEGDPARFTTHMDYDARDLLISQTDPMGHRTSFTYDKARRLIREEQPRGAATSSIAQDFTIHTTYDANGDLKSRSIPLADKQYGKTGDQLDDLRIEYTRDAVGNPVEIKDARGNSFSNAFYDTGGLLRTKRPSWWNLDWGPGRGAPDPARQFARQGSGSEPDTQAPVGGPTISEGNGQGPSSSAIGVETPSMPGAGDFGSANKEQIPSFMPRAGLTTLSYDNEMRLSQIKDGTGATSGLTYDGQGRVLEKRMPFMPGDPIVHSYTYDPNGNLTRFADGEANERGDAWATTWQYDSFDRPVVELSPGSRASESDPSNYASLVHERTDYRYDPNSNLLERDTARGQLTFRFGFDAVDRLVSESNPLGQDWTYGYDAGGNTTSTTSPRDTLTQLTYDPANRLEKMTDAAGTSLARSTSFGYDANGNQTRIVAPGAADSVGGAEKQFITLQTFDGLNRPWKTTTAAESDHARTTITETDANGNLRRTVNAKGVIGHGSDAVAATADSDPQGTQLSGTAPQPSSGASDAAVNASVGEYDADGLLRFAHQPHANEAPQGTGANAAGVDVNLVDQKAENAKRYVQRFDYNSRGWLESQTDPYLRTDPEGARTSYTYLDSGWVASVTDPQLVDPDDATRVATKAISYTYDERGNQTSWKTVGKNSPSAAARDFRVNQIYYPSGLLAARNGALPNTTGGETETRKYEYFYNPNRSLVRMIDHAWVYNPYGPRQRTTQILRDDAERELTVDELWRTGQDTRFRYDEEGNLTTRLVEGDVNETPSNPNDDDFTGGRKTTFVHDRLNRETSMTVDRTVGDDSDLGQVWSTEYFSSGLIKKLSKNTDPGTPAAPDAGYETTESYGWRQDGLMRQKVRTPASGIAETENYVYDANGNRTDDERGVHAFNARDQLIYWNSPDQGAVSYDLDGSGQTERELINDPTDPDHTYSYVGRRLRKVQTIYPGAPTKDTESQYLYDGVGNVVQIKTVSKSGGQFPPAPAPPAEVDICKTEQWNDPGSTYYCYDEFSRMVYSQAPGAEDPEVVVYDGLDRREAKLAGGTDPYLELSYIGTSERLTREERQGGSLARYDYNSNGVRSGQHLRSGSGAADYKSYATDANGSVIGLEDDADGSIASNEKYQYDPYGDLIDPQPDDQEDAEEELGDRAADNPFRFDSFYYDSGVKTYDMLARHYRPETGRFLSEDRYADAGADLSLQTDPLTQNRYVFAGANPVSNVEFDGHCFWSKAAKRFCKQVIGALFGDTAKKAVGAGSQALGESLGLLGSGSPPPPPPPPPPGGGLKNQAFAELEKQGEFAREIVEVSAAQGEPLTTSELKNHYETYTRNRSGATPGQITEMTVEEECQNLGCDVFWAVAPSSLPEALLGFVPFGVCKAKLCSKITGIFSKTSPTKAATVRTNPAFPRGREYVEKSHWLIPQRTKWVPEGIRNARWNLKPMWGTDHALADPFRYRFLPRSWKAENPLPGPVTRFWNRTPVWAQGTSVAAGGGGSAYGFWEAWLDD